MGEVDFEVVSFDNVGRIVVGRAGSAVGCDGLCLGGGDGGR